MPKAPTDEEIAHKLLTDPRYWIESCLTIVDQYMNRVPFLFNWMQGDFHESQSELDIIVKPRKAGFSSKILAHILWACATQKYYRCAIVSHEEEATARLLMRVKDYIKNSAIGIRTKTLNTSEISFPDTNAYLYIGTAGAKSFGRGDDLNIVHLSESAHYEDRTMIAGVQEALVKGAPTWIVQETTAKGAGTPFHQAWLKAIDPDPRTKSAWKGHFYGWHQDPLNTIQGAPPYDLDDVERGLREAFNLSWEQLAWRKKKLETMDDPELFPQEYPITWQEAFLASGLMVFDWKAIKRQEDSAQKPKWVGHIVDSGEAITIEPDPKGPLSVWITPDDKTKYLIVCDAADGVKGGAYSVADVYDMRTWEQVAQYRGHPDPVAFAEIVMRLGVFYRWAMLACENNYPGNAVIAQWTEGSYPNIYDDPEEAGGKMGWTTTGPSRSQFISEGRASLKDGSLKINSRSTLNEFSTFVLNESGKMTHQAGCFSDTVITACKAAQILKRSHVEPEIYRPKFKDVMGFGRRKGNSMTGGEFKTRVV